MSHPIHHALQIRTSREKPQRVRVPKIMYPNTEVDARRFDSVQPHSGSEGVNARSQCPPRCWLRHFGERRLGKEVRTTFGGCLTCANTTYPKGYARRGTKAVMLPPHH